MSQPVELEYEALCRALESVPFIRNPLKKEPTEAQRRALLKYWPTSRDKESMARKFGISENTARRWYKEAVEREIEERR